MPAAARVCVEDANCVSNRGAVPPVLSERPVTSWSVPLGLVTVMRPPVSSLTDAPGTLVSTNARRLSSVVASVMVSVPVSGRAALGAVERDRLPGGEAEVRAARGRHRRQRRRLGRERPGAEVERAELADAGRRGLDVHVGLGQAEHLDGVARLGRGGVGRDGVGVLVAAGPVRARRSRRRRWSAPRRPSAGGEARRDVLQRLLLGLLAILARLDVRDRDALEADQLVDDRVRVDAGAEAGEGDASSPRQPARSSHARARVSVDGAARRVGVDGAAAGADVAQPLRGWRRAWRARDALVRRRDVAQAGDQAVGLGAGRCAASSVQQRRRARRAARRGRRGRATRAARSRARSAPRAGGRRPAGASRATPPAGGRPGRTRRGGR